MEVGSFLDDFIQKMSKKTSYLTTGISNFNQATKAIAIHHHQQIVHYHPKIHIIRTPSVTIAQILVSRDIDKLKIATALLIFTQRLVTSREQRPSVVQHS